MRLTDGMGIPLIYSYLAKNYPKCITKYLNSKSVITEEFSDIDTFLIDGNATLHPVARKYYFTPTQKKRLLGKQKIQKEEIKTDQECYEKIGEYIEELFLRVKPKKFFYAIDGTVNIAKSAEQRKRRFLSSYLASQSAIKKGEILSEEREITNSVPVGKFDTTNISVATPWMKNLHKFLNKFFIKLGFKYPNTTFVYQSYLNPGEGEHRLIDYIRNLKLSENESIENESIEKCMIHANDADVICLMLGLHRENCYILRDRVDEFSDQCSVIDISKLRYELLNNYLPYCGDRFSDFDKINSIIFLWYFVGNDFLARNPSLEIFNNGLEDIASSLHKTMMKHGSIVTFKDDDNFEINLKALVFWMREIAKRDIILIQRKATDSKYVPDPIIVRNMVSDTNNIIVNEVEYKKDYNRTHFGDEIGLRNVCKEYINGLWWTFEYYSKASPSWTWYYPHHYSPWIGDIANFIESEYFEIPKFELGSPVPEELQLLFILPPKSFYLLPKPLQGLKNKYPEMFPNEVIIDRSGTEFEWDQKVLLPFADFELLKKEYYKLYPYKQNRKCSTLNVTIRDV